MNRRYLHDSINSNTNLAQAGVDANLIFDRLLTITDDSGLAPGEAFIIKARCFPFCEEMSVDRILLGVKALAEREMIYVGIWRGREVISFNSEAFQRFQGLRKDYKRRFEFAELSQVVWDQGLHGFRTGVERIVHGIVAMPSPSPMPSPMPIPTPAPCGGEPPHPPSHEPQKANGIAKVKKPREPDPIWDVIAELFYGRTVPTGQAKSVGAVVRDLKELGATPSQIRGHHKRMREKWSSNVTVTMHSIVKHWAAFTEEACEAEKEKWQDDFAGV